MADVPVLLPLPDRAAWDEVSATRRIAQLESALARRNDQLGEAHSALAATHDSHAYKFARLISRLANKFLPLHSRRRRATRTLLRSVVRGIRRITGRNIADWSQGGEGTQVALDTAQYVRWIAKHEPTPADLAKQRKSPPSRQPLISIVVPAYNTPAEHLRSMLRSVIGQTYPRWELCIVDGASTSPQVEQILSEAASDDSRIKFRWLDNNLGIAGNTNAALELVTGDYVALLDHDDELSPWALYSVVEAINRRPGADVIYSDEDKLDEIGHRVDPCFKPGWSPDWLRTHNYVCHLLVLSASLVKDLGGVRTGFDGAQDYDLVLRASEQSREIVHVPQVLYHWRMHRQSTAANTDSKQYLVEAGRKALQEHLDRSGASATAHPGDKPGVYRVAYHLKSQPLVSVLIPNRDQAAILSRCIDSLERSTYANYEVLILENGSTDGNTLSYYRQLSLRPNVRLLAWDRPFNYAAVNNFGAAHARGELLLFMNNDVESLHPDWLEALATHAVRPEIGAVGAKLLYADGTVQHAGIVLGMGGVAGHVAMRFSRESAGYADQLRRAREVAAVTGACLMTRRSVFEQVGGFDERFELAYNDVDYGMAVRQAGYRVLWTPEAELYHLESKTRGYEDDPAKQARFRREFDLFRLKWARELAAGDPYYSPHFRLDRCDYALRA